MYCFTCIDAYLIWLNMVIIKFSISNHKTTQNWLFGNIYRNVTDRSNEQQLANQQSVSQMLITCPFNLYTRKKLEINLMINFMQQN